MNDLKYYENIKNYEKLILNEILKFINLNDIKIKKIYNEKYYLINIEFIEINLNDLKLLKYILIENKKLNLNDIKIYIKKNYMEIDLI